VDSSSRPKHDALVDITDLEALAEADRALAARLSHESAVELSTRRKAGVSGKNVYTERPFFVMTHESVYHD
jgi:hypothetical protein